MNVIIAISKGPNLYKDYTATPLDDVFKNMVCYFTSILMRIWFSYLSCLVMRIVILPNWNCAWRSRIGWPQTGWNWMVVKWNSLFFILKYTFRPCKTHLLPLVNVSYLPVMSHLWKAWEHILMQGVKLEAQIKTMWKWAWYHFF